jgi:hypothetical protein
MEGQVKTASWISVLFSIWLIISPFVLAFSGLSALAMWDAIIVGVIVLILSGIRALNPTSSSALSWVSALLGVWMIISPFVLGTSHLTAVMWDDIVVGVAFVIFNAWAALATNRTATA